MTHTACYCSRCVPNDHRKHPHVSTCARCGQETRFGIREEKKGWWHREDVDHVTVHGHSPPPEAQPEPEPTEEEVAHQALQNATVEVWAHDVDPTEFAPQSGLRQIANLVSGVTRKSPTTGKPSKSPKHPAMAPGWELVNLHHARGPYRGAKGEVLSISDTHVLRARGPVELDGSRRIAVASWRDLAFDFAFIGTIKDGRLNPRKVGSDEMKDWIKGHDLPDPVREPGE